MTEERWYAGVDWASESHLVFLTDGTGRKIGEKYFKHGGDGLAEMAAWLMAGEWRSLSSLCLSPSKLALASLQLGGAASASGCGWERARSNYPRRTIRSPSPSGRRTGCKGELVRIEFHPEGQATAAGAELARA